MKAKAIKISLLIFVSLGGGIFVLSDSSAEGSFEAAGKDITLTENRLAFRFQERGEQTVGEFLAAEKITLAQEDFVLPSPETPLHAGTTIVIERAKPLIIRVDGGERVLKTHALTVADALAEADILVEEDDIVSPERTVSVTPNLEVKITRVEIREETVEKNIAYDTRTEEDAELSWRTKKVKVKGENGIRAITYRVSYHDGKEVNRKEIESLVTKEPVTEVVAQGTYVKTGKKHTGLGTWYAHTGTLAAASPWLPMGSYVRVTNEANGQSVIVVINDRGPFGPNRIIDLDKVAFEQIASLGAGVINVKVEEITN